MNVGKLCREKPKTEELWIQARADRGIGGSDAAAIVGASPWKTANDLWMEMTGKKEPKDISDDPFVQQGHRMEYAIRELYKAYHPDYKVKHNPYHLLYQSDRPWLFATLDGEVVLPDKRKGCLECKTNTPVGKAGWEKWDCKIPNAYMIQILHEMLASGYDFVDLVALLINQEGDFTVRTYHFDRADHEEDLAWLLDKETAFWQSVQNKAIPPMTLIL